MLVMFMLLTLSVANLGDRIRNYSHNREINKKLDTILADIDSRHVGDALRVAGERAEQIQEFQEEHP